MEIFDLVFEKAAYIIGLIGMATIVFGAFSAVYEILTMLIKKGCKEFQLDSVRQHLMAYMALSLDFSIGKDVIETFLGTDMERLLQLGLIVIIRVVLGYFLDLEIRNLKKEHEKRK